MIRSVDLAGDVDSDGGCEGSKYADPYGSWKDVVVQGTIRITLRQQTVRVSLENNRIHLSSGTICKLSDGSCMDGEGGQTFWDPIPLDQCGFNKYGLLYEGNAKKLTDVILNKTQIVYSLSTRDVTFALTAKGYDNVCGYMVTKTEHPRLAILETTRGETFTSKAVSIDNLDIFTYVNSKFIYVEKHLRAQVKDLYRDVLLNQCYLERIPQKLLVYCFPIP